MRAVRAVARRVPGLRPAVHGFRRMMSAALDRPRIAELDYPRVRIVIEASSPAVVHSRLHPVAKEPWTVQWLETRIRLGDVLWDIGANVGGYSLIAAKLGVDVVAVEPSSVNFAALCENIVLNDCAAAVTPLPIVLAASTGLVALEHGNRHAGATHRIAPGPAPERRQPVLGFSLDELLERFDLRPPTLIKLDVDGAEPAVLAGAASTLARPGLRSVLIEIESQAEAEVVSAVKAAGLDLSERYAERDGLPLRGVWYGVFDRT